MKFSSFAQRFNADSGIVQLMDDLGNAMAGNEQVMMLGGGNPGHIPEVQQYFTGRMQRILDQPGEFGRMIGNYDPPQGPQSFNQAIAELLNREYGWDLTHRNVALTAGSQSAFFLLFNMLAGEFADGQSRRILLPMAPEYIGYSDVGLMDGLFVSRRPAIEKREDRFFKYHVNLDPADVDDSIGALCISRPTNPTGNVITDDELDVLMRLAMDRDIPLIVDNAYGAPFPDIIFTDVKPVWNEQVILCLSLSKLGLPGVRTGIVIARETIIETLTHMSAIMNLAQGSFGPALAMDLVQSGEIITLSHQVIRSYYRQKADAAIGWIREAIHDIEYFIHTPEGAIFLWLWFPQLPISTRELYQRLKRRGVLIIPGEYFFPGLDEDWPHKQQCIRLTYSQDAGVVKQGIDIIADEVRKLSSEQGDG